MVCLQTPQTTQDRRRFHGRRHYGEGGVLKVDEKPLGSGGTSFIIAIEMAR